MNLSLKIGNVTLKNPVTTGSGTFGFGREYNEFYDISELGAVCVKGLTLLPREGNPPPRIAETPSGILNSVGLQNPGVHYFITHELPNLKQLGATVIANIAGNTVEDYCRMAEIISDSETDIIEMNISCPNVKEGGVAFGTKCDTAARITDAVRKKAKKPLIVKLSPNVSDIAEMARAVENSGADAISLINTLTGMVIDIHTRRPILHNNIGGLSGPAVKPVAVRMVWQCANAVKIPIIGMGGITCGDDAIEFMLAGANAVSVGTANFSNPTAAIDVLHGIESYFTKNKINNIDEIRGKVEIY